MLWSLALAYLGFYLIKITIGLRVSRKEEIEGLDLGEHGLKAYDYNYIKSNNIVLSSLTKK